MAAAQIGLSSSNTPGRNFQGQVGGYAISTVNFESWGAGAQPKTQQKARKARGVKEIVHKLFAECAAVTTDSFWADKFTLASYGKLPPKFSFHDNVLSYCKGAKNFSVEVPVNPYDAVQTCTSFFRTHGGIFSPSDERNSLEMQYMRTQSELEQIEMTWADTNKKIQECLLSFYVMEMKSRMGLANIEVDQLRQTIRLGIGNKFFGKHNIKMVDNNIHSIQGLLWNPDKRSFFIDPSLKPITARNYVRKKTGVAAVDPSQKDMIPQFSIKWTKYIECLEKKISQHNRRQRRITIIPNMSMETRGLRMVTTSGQLVTTVTSQTEATTTNDDTEESYDEEDEDE